MQQYQYMSIPFIGVTKGAQSADVVAKQLTDLINSYAGKGWEFVQLGDVNIRVSPGCLASIFGASVSYVRHDQVIFRRSS